METRLVENFNGEAKARDFIFISDEREESAGTDKGPAPLEYFLSGFAFCEQIIFARHAAALGLDLDRLELKVKGLFRRRGMYGTAEVDPGFEETSVEFRVESKESKELAIDPVWRVHKHCPAYNTLRKAAKISEGVFLNDEELALN